MINIGDRVKVIGVSLSYRVYINELNNYVGKVGIVKYKDNSGIGVNVLFNDGRSLYFPLISLILENDTTYKKLTIESLYCTSKVTISNSLNWLNL